MSDAKRMQPSNEADAGQLALSEQEGRAFETTVEEMTDHEAHGTVRRSGDYVIGLAQENAEGMYVRRNGRLEWQEPTEENAHFEVVVQQAGNNRFVPNLSVTVTILDVKGREIGVYPHPFLWHPWLYHYGRNWTLPGDGDYTVRVHVDPPDFPRHDKTNGRVFEQPADVEFAAFTVKTGRKPS